MDLNQMLYNSRKDDFYTQQAYNLWLTREKEYLEEMTATGSNINVDQNINYSSILLTPEYLRNSKKYLNGETAVTALTYVISRILLIYVFRVHIYTYPTIQKPIFDY